MWTAGYNIASSWITAITPRLNMLIAAQNWLELDRLFNKNLIRCIVTTIIGGMIFFILDCFFINQLQFFQRLLPITSMLILFFCWLGQTYVNSVAVYLRAHKKEPLMQLSFCSAIYVAIGTWLSAQYLQPDLLFMGFFSSYFWEIPIVIKIFLKQKREHVVHIG